MTRSSVVLFALACVASVQCPEALQRDYTAHRNIVYRDVSGVDPNLVSLDVYTPSAPIEKPIPALVFVHGGGWAIGDKGNQMQYKPAWFTQAGYCFVSINYRLSPRPAQLDNPARIMYPIHEQDVAAAVAWVHTHIAEYGGDPARVVLMGHSAGAHLVNLIGTDGSFLAEFGLHLDDLRGVIVLDTGGYDIPEVMQHSPLDLYRNAFGDDPAIWSKASPVNYVAPGKGIRPMLLVTRGLPWRKDEAKHFAGLMLGAGYKATVLDATGYSHADINRRIGEPGERLVTPAVMEFLAGVVR